MRKLIVLFGFLGIGGGEIIRRGMIEIGCNPLLAGGCALVIISITFLLSAIAVNTLDD